MKHSKLIISLMAFSLAGLLSGCYPDKVDYVDEYDLAGTMYDEEVDFSSFTSFHVIDTVMHVTDDDEDNSNLSRENDEFILNLIRQNMLDLGYTEMANPDSLNRPDLELLVNAMTSDYYTYYSYWNSYWGWYGGWGWWYPGGGYYPGYPGYPGGGLYYSYSTGTLAIEMLDTKAEVGEDDDRPGVVWVGLVDGILTSSSSQGRLEKQINQVFTQSPYLQK
jgi:hypothetical protein